MKKKKNNPSPAPALIKIGAPVSLLGDPCRTVCDPAKAKDLKKIIKAAGKKRKKG